MNVPKVPRAPWGEFPDTVIVTDERAFKSHAAYDAAKTGDVAAATELAAAFTAEPVIERVRGLLAGRQALIAPVHAFEDQGINRIPAAFGELLAHRLGLEVSEDIVQANVVSHTHASGWGRIARPPVFEGPVHSGRDYSAKLALNPETLRFLREKHGPDLENWWDKTFGYAFDRLTESEARYLLRAENADTIRTRLLEARP